MNFDILQMITRQTARWAAAFPDTGPFGTVYAVVFVLSLLTAVITFGFVVFKREGGAVSASLIVQWVAVWLIPVVGPTVITAFKGGGGGAAETATEAMRVAMMMF